MKILHVCLTREFAGSEQYCATLAAAQAEAGHDVRVLIRGGRDEARINRWRKTTGGALTLAIAWWVPFRWIRRQVGFRLLRDFGPDVIHSHLGRANLRVAKRKKQVPGLVWVSSVHLRWKPKEMMDADGLVCVAGWQKPDIEQSGYKGKLRVIWNWLPPQAPASADAVRAIRDRLNCSDRTVVIGSVGRLHGQKGMDVLIRAFRSAFDHGEDVRLLIVGEGDERPRLEGLAGSDRRIVFAGYQEQLSPWYEAMDVYVSAARYEPFGLTILEAMAHGCRLVCTRTEGPSEFLQDSDRRGLVHWAERGQAESIAAAMLAAVAKGRARVTHDMAPFAISRAVREMDAFYEEVKAAART